MVAVDVWKGKMMVDIRSSEQEESRASLFHSKHVRIRSNNQAVISAINTGKVKDDFLGHGMRYIHYVMAVRDSTLSLLYVNTKDNVIADRLSRGDNHVVGELREKGFKQIFVSHTHLSNLMSVET